MKKVKVMLAGIAVFAVISGAFAFKAKNTFSSIVYTTVGGVEPSGSSACNVKEVNITTTTDVQSGQSPVYYTVAGAPADCYTTSLVYTKFMH
jgi:hypothetical protein